MWDVICRSLLNEQFSFHGKEKNRWLASKKKPNKTNKERKNTHHRTLFALVFRERVFWVEFSCRILLIEFRIRSYAADDKGTTLNACHDDQFMGRQTRKSEENVEFRALWLDWIVRCTALFSAINLYVWTHLHRVEAACERKRQLYQAIFWYLVVVTIFTADTSAIAAVVAAVERNSPSMNEWKRKY